GRCANLPMLHRGDGGGRGRGGGLEALSLDTRRALVFRWRSRARTLHVVCPMTTATVAASARPELPVRTRIGIFVRLLAIQGAWNYETLLGNGIGFCIEPALRFLPGGIHSPAFHAALARESRYFNAHPYLAAV